VDVLGALCRYAASQAALQLEIAKQYPDIHLQPGYEFDQETTNGALESHWNCRWLNQNRDRLQRPKQARRSGGEIHKAAGKSHGRDRSGP